MLLQGNGEYSADEFGRAVRKVLDKGKEIIDLAQQAKESYEATKAEYEKAEEELNRINEQIETHNTQLSEKELTRQRLTGEIQVFEEQIKTIQVNAAHYQQRMTAIENETAHKNTEIDGLNKQKEELRAACSLWQ